MTKKNYQRLRRKIDTHTKNALFEWSDSGHGANTKRAVASVSRLEAFVEQLVDEEVTLALAAAVRNGGPG